MERNIMNRFLIMLILVVLGAGCSTVTTPKIISKTELKYKKIVFLPIVEGSDSLKVAADTYLFELLNKADGIELVSRDQLNNQFFSNLGISDPIKYSVLDFSVSAQGYERRKIIKDAFNADAILLVSCFRIKDSLSLYVQLIDVEDGELSLSFSRVLELQGSQDEVLKELVALSAEKIDTHLKDNVVITTIRRYN